MDLTPTGPPSTAPPPTPGAFRWQKLPAWLASCTALGLLTAWSAVVGRGYAAPLVLFPLVVGAVLGGMLVLVMRVLDVGHRPSVLLGALLAGLLTVAGEHYFTFWKTQHRLTEDPERAVKLRLVAPERIPPADFPGFLVWSAEWGLPIGEHKVQGGLAWFVWTVDGLLVLVPAVILVGVTARLPYCNRCRRWYHTVRSGRLDALAAAELGDLIPSGFKRESSLQRYRLLACEEACGPTGVAISCEGPDGRPLCRTVWLDAAGRERVSDVLDGCARRRAARDGDDEAQEASPRETA